MKLKYFDLIFPTHSNWKTEWSDIWICISKLSYTNSIITWNIKFSQIFSGEATLLSLTAVGLITDFLIFCYRFPLVSTPPINIKFRKILNPLIIRNPPNLRKISLPNGIFPAITKKIQEILIQKSVQWCLKGFFCFILTI